MRRTTIFTTHTPVPAGHDAFPFNLVETHLAGAWGTLGAYRDAFLALGHYDNGSGPLFNMTALALRTAGAVNAVSQLHGAGDRARCGTRSGRAWPTSKRPVGRHHQRRARADLAVVGDWRRCSTIISVPTGASATTTRRCGPRSSRSRTRSSGPRARRCATTCSRSSASAPGRAGRKSASAPPRVVAAGTLLDPNALTIGFARRFTGYKRPELIFHNPDRLLSILNAQRRPVQIVFAGKAHPADETGKHHLQQVYRRAIDPMFGGRIAFVDDYDLHVAHFLVQGCDVWLNNPRKPLEASGTSGMKASINGVPHLSIGDGWWAEGYTGKNGWLIEGQAPAARSRRRRRGRRRSALSPARVPRSCRRSTIATSTAFPGDGCAVVRQAILSVTPRFSARRMVKDTPRRCTGRR